MARHLTAAILAIFLTGPAWGHGEQGWMIKYRNAEGVSCCHEADTVAVPNEVAAGAKIGSVIVAPFQGGPVPVVVNAIHATEDRRGRAMVTAYGCLFKPFGG